MYLFMCALRGSICINLSVPLLPLDVHFEKMMVVPLASEESESVYQILRHIDICRQHHHAWLVYILHTCMFTCIF